jgi:glycosyltransferase involved in cell wall biosynthesis
MAAATARAYRPRITIFTRSYPPAYLAGGPARSLHGLVETLAADFRFSVVTSAFDGPVGGLMTSVTVDRWTRFGHAATWYELGRRRRPWQAAALLRTTRPQVVYLNSLFDFRFSILPLLATRLMPRQVPVVLAPRGELAGGALALSRAKKRLFIAVFRALGLHRAITWHASTEQEQADIERVFGAEVRSRVAIDLRAGLADSPGAARPAPARPGTCSLVFFARIVPVKNLAAVIGALSLVTAPDVRLTIGGPVEDAKYWAQCQQLISGLGEPAAVSYVGAVPAQQAVSFLGQFDLLVLPTLGENFGHVVLESLAAGTPVVVGRETPWRQVETAGAGWLCNPDDPAEIADLIGRFAALNDTDRLGMRRAARGVADAVLADQNGVAANRLLFRGVVGRQT